MRIAAYTGYFKGVGGPVYDLTLERRTVCIPSKLRGTRDGFPCPPAMGCGRQSLPPPARQSRICVASLRCSSVKYVEYSPSSRLGPLATAQSHSVRQTVRRSSGERPRSQLSENADQDPGAGGTVMGLNPSHFSPARTSRDWMSTGSGCSPTRRATSLPAPSKNRNVGTPSTPFLAATARPSVVETSMWRTRILCREQSRSAAATTGCMR